MKYVWTRSVWNKHVLFLCHSWPVCLWHDKLKCWFLYLQWLLSISCYYTPVPGKFFCEKKNGTLDQIEGSIRALEMAKIGMCVVSEWAWWYCYARMHGYHFITQLCFYLTRGNHNWQVPPAHEKVRKMCRLCNYNSLSAPACTALYVLYAYTWMYTEIYHSPSNL